jgi:hypothetical protein
MVTLAHFLTETCLKVEGFLFDSYYRIPSDLTEEDQVILKSLVNEKFPIFTLVIGGNRKLYKFLKIHNAEKIL